jgi:hypothetical protein
LHAAEVADASMDVASLWLVTPPSLPPPGLFCVAPPQLTTKPTATRPETHRAALIVTSPPSAYAHVSRRAMAELHALLGSG